MKSCMKYLEKDNLKKKLNTSENTPLFLQKRRKNVHIKLNRYNKGCVRKERSYPFRIFFLL